MGNRQIPVLGRIRHAVSIKYQVDNILTRLYIVQENQFQIVDNTRVASLKRAFKDCNSLQPEDLADLAYNEITKALYPIFESRVDISTRVEKIKDMDYRLIISGSVYNENGDRYDIEEMVSYNGSSFRRMVDETNGDR
jgi:hypothetical protein